MPKPDSASEPILAEQSFEPAQLPVRRLCRASREGRSRWRVLAAAYGFLFAASALGQNSVGPAVIGWEGRVEVSRSATAPWDPAYTNQILQAGDLVRTGDRSRAIVQVSPRTVVRMGERSLLRVPAEPGKRGVLNLLKGVLYLFHRDKPGEFPVETPTGYAAVLGTEFNVNVAEDGTTRLDLIDGQVALTNQFGQVDLKSGEAAAIEPGKAPARTPMLNAVRAVQWGLYYPGILHLDELNFSADEKAALQPSIDAYASGDLLQALGKYPVDRQPASDSERIYFAALLLSVGQITEAEKILGGITAKGTPERLVASLRRLIAVVNLETSVITPPDHASELATEWLAASYAEQAQSKLPEALVAARRAVERAPGFAFGWERVAELEFSFGRISAAQTALQRSLSLAPRNAQAVALNGFLRAARNRFIEAASEFDRAIALDSALGNAWLGRGLVRIHRGRVAEGQSDLVVAATVEPQRAALRSYLGKAFAEGGDAERTTRELALAQQLDPMDPTPWLYSALFNQEQNRINEAIRDLEKSQELNGDRAVYRSQLLLDQDQSVRGANLAAIYQDAGMTDVAAREAARAVNADYANFSSHLFLANTYDALRDPNQVNLRYETPWLSEYLVANLLAPVGAGTLSPAVSQQEYSKLLEKDRVGVVSSTEYLSNGDWVQSGAVYGVAGNSGFALEEYYGSRNGQRRNNDLEQLSLSLQFKQQLTPVDGLYFQAVYYKAEGGDLAQRYDPADANTGVRFKETQEPLLLAGYHHEWGPGSHTLVLAGRLQDTLKVNNPQQNTLLVDNSFAPPTVVQPITIEQEYESDLVIYTAEAQQIWQRGEHTVIGGVRFQAGDVEARNQPGDAPGFPSGFFPTQRQVLDEDFARASAYLYEQWQVIPSLRLIGGVSYDWLKAPDNFRYAPLNSGEETTDLLSPKAGLIFTPCKTTTLRAGYAQSLGGMSFDQSFALEPTQVAGFNQAWRSLIPESVAGANSGATFETWGAAIDEKFDTGTYLGLSLELLKSMVDRTVGIYESPSFLVITPSDTREKLDYEERSLVFSANQLLGREWSLGGRYRVSQAELHDNFTEIPASAVAAPPGSFQPRQRTESVLHEIDLYLLFTHASGFFGMAESAWYSQSNEGYTPDRPGDDFWQFNFYVGYRFPRRRAEIKLGLLNITDQDYRLNPLNLTAELPRDRTLMASFRFNF